MTAIEFLKTIFEFAAVVSLIVGFINEKKVVAFEKKHAIAIRYHWNSYKARRSKHLDDPEKFAQEIDSQFDTPKVALIDTWKNKNYKEG